MVKRMVEMRVEMKVDMKVLMRGKCWAERLAPSMAVKMEYKKVKRMVD